MTAAEYRELAKALRAKAKQTNEVPAFRDGQIYAIFTGLAKVAEHMAEWAEKRK